jgi:hypothetical protein
MRKYFCVYPQKLLKRVRKRCPSFDGSRNRRGSESVSTNGYLGFGNVCTFKVGIEWNTCYTTP